MTILNPGEASKQMKEAAEDLKALSESYVLMRSDQHVGAALAVAEYKMQVAASNYVQSNSGNQPTTPQVRPAHRAPGSNTEGKPYSRTDVRPPTTGIGQGPGAAVPIGPLNTPIQQAPIQRVSAAGHVPTAAGLPDAVIPPGAQLHPRTLARLRQAQGLPPEDVPPTFAQQVASDAGAVGPPPPPPPRSPSPSTVTLRLTRTYMDPSRSSSHGPREGSSRCKTCR
jgi:hypothetical protein